MSLTAAVAWGPNRLDVFGIEIVGGLGHRAWLGDHWHPSTGWQELGVNELRHVDVASWGPDRLDIFVGAVSTDTSDGSYSHFHKAWEGTHWAPSVDGWLPFGPDHFFFGPTAVSWGANRLDVFIVDNSSWEMRHRAWNGSNWTQGWEHLGGQFTSEPGVASWGPNRLDIFGLGESSAMFHKAWLGTHWHPLNPHWENLGGKFLPCKPAVVSWGPGRLDIFGIGEHNGMYHKAWDGSKWLPSVSGWQALGGQFIDVNPAAASWGPNRLDVFAIGKSDYQMYHKAWDGSQWQPPNPQWEPLGGDFSWSAEPAVASWGPNRLDVFLPAPGDQMHHKAWDGSQWYPSQTGWQALGGQFQVFPWT